RHALQGERQRLDDKVVDRKLVGRLAVLVLASFFGRGGVDLLARFKELADIAVNGEIKMRNGLHRSGEPLRDSAAHAIMRHELVAALVVQRADLLIRHGRRDERRRGACWCRWRAGCTQATSGFRFLDIARNHAAMWAGAGNAADIDASVLGETARERKRENSVGAAWRCTVPVGPNSLAPSLSPLGSGSLRRQWWTRCFRLLKRGRTLLSSGRGRRGLLCSSSFRLG